MKTPPPATFIFSKLSETSNVGSGAALDVTSLKPRPPVPKKSSIPPDTSLLVDSPCPFRSMLPRPSRSRGDLPPCAFRCSRCAWTIHQPASARPTHRLSVFGNTSPLRSLLSTSRARPGDGALAPIRPSLSFQINRPSSDSSLPPRKQRRPRRAAA